MSSIPIAPRVEQLEQLELLAVIRTGGIAEPGPDAPMALGNDVVGVAASSMLHLRSGPGVKVRGKGFGQPIGQRFHEDRAVVVVRLLELPRQFVGADSGGDGKRSDVIGRARSASQPRNPPATSSACRRRWLPAGAAC